MPINKSGFTKHELSFRAKNKDLVNKMTNKDFGNSVFKPNDEVAPFVPHNETKDLLKEVIPTTTKEYTNEFNRNLHILNDIIEKNNKSGMPYKATGIDEAGKLKFDSPLGPSEFTTNIKPGR